MAKIERGRGGRVPADRGGASRGPLLLALAGAAVGALVWWARARGGTTGAVYRRVLRRTPLTDAERRAVERGGDAPETAAALVTDITLADRNDRYAG